MSGRKSSLNIALRSFSSSGRPSIICACTLKPRSLRIRKASFVSSIVCPRFIFWRTSLFVVCTPSSTRVQPCSSMRFACSSLDQSGFVSIVKPTQRIFAVSFLFCSIANVLVPFLARIFSFAVSSGERSVLVEDSFTQSAATIFSGKVYWVDSQSGSTDIYTLDMGGSCSIDLGDCADDDADISPVAEEVCDDEIDNNCNGDVDTDCGAVKEVVVDCTETWDCSNVEWSSCVNRSSTRDLTLCLVVPENELCFAEEYLQI